MCVFYRIVEMEQISNMAMLSFYGYENLPRKQPQLTGID